MSRLMIRVALWRIRALTDRAHRILDRRDWWRALLTRVEGVPPEK